MSHHLFFLHCMKKNSIREKEKKIHKGKKTKNWHIWVWLKAESNSLGSGCEADPIALGMAVKLDPVSVGNDLGLAAKSNLTIFGTEYIKDNASQQYFLIKKQKRQCPLTLQCCLQCKYSIAIVWFAMQWVYIRNKYTLFFEPFLKYSIMFPFLFLLLQFTFQYFLVLICLLFSWYSHSLLKL
jgi:hypothetical protein